MEDTKLENPVWHSLNEIHKGFCLEHDAAKFYDPETCPFGSFVKPGKTTAINDYAKHVDDFYVVGEKPAYSNKVTLIKNLVCNQMVLSESINVSITEQIVELKTDEQKTELFALVNFVQPGFFNAKTAELGKYFGIYKNDQLIAVTGERMKMNSFTEISAVVTHPEHTGNGYAKQLITLTVRLICKEHKTPYLHVAETNIGAIKLYETLGFSTRRKISFWHFSSA